MGGSFDRWVADVCTPRPARGCDPWSWVVRWGVDVVDADSGEPDPSGALDIVNGLRAHGVLISATGRHGNVLKIRPPLPISASDVDEFLTRFEMVLVA